MQWGDESDPVTSASYNLSYTYANNRVTNTGFSYDADGRQIAGVASTNYDAAGRTVYEYGADLNATHYYNGDGAEAKRETVNSVFMGTGYDIDTTTTYFIRSSVLGGKTITEHSTTEHIDGYTRDTTYTSRYKSYVYAGGSEIAYDIHVLSYYGGYLDNVYFEHSDSSGMSYKTSYNNGTVASGTVAREDSPMELDGMASNVGTFKPSSYETAYFPLHHISNDSPRAVDPQKMCNINGTTALCSEAIFLIQMGAGAPDPSYGPLDLFGFGIFGHWEDRDDPNFKPSDPDNISGGGIITSFVVDSIGSGDDFTIAPGQSISENPCDLMAQNAQNIVNHLGESFSNLTSQKKLEEFTRVFQTWYTGGWVGMTNWSAWSWNQKAQGSTTGITGEYQNLPNNKWDTNQLSGRVERLVTSSPYRGQKDFRSSYREVGAMGDGADQTHHFAAYFALGVAGLSFAAWVHEKTDATPNLADRLLGARAYNMGDFLRKNPDELKNVAYAIRSFICEPKSKPRLLFR